MIRLKELRIEKGLSQSEIAKILNVNQTAIGKYERGETEPNIKNLITLSSFFGVSVDYLLDLEDDFGNITIQSESPQLTDSERELLETFRRMPENLQKIAINTLHSFAGDDEKQQKISESSTSIPRRA